MNKLALYHWWIALLMLSGSLSQAQESEINSSPNRISDFSTCKTNCYNEWIIQGNHHFDQKSYQEAIPYFESALRQKRKEGDPQLIVQCLIDLSFAVAYDQQFERARAHLEEASWLMRQQPFLLYQLKSDHLITKIRQTVDALEKARQPISSKIPQPPPPIPPTLWQSLQKAVKYGSFTGFILLFFVFWIGIYTTGKHRQEAEIESAHLKQLLKYLQQQQLVEQEEKRELLSQNKRLAADMQDGLGNLISSVKLHVEQIEAEEEGAGASRTQNLQKVSSWLEQACVDLRCISQKLLNRQPARSGLVNMLNQHREYLLAAGFEEVKIFHYGLEKELTLEQESGIYGIIMTWTRFLAFNRQAKAIQIQLHLDPEGLNLIIEDDGPEIVFSNHKNTPEAFLLRDLKRRIAALGGEMEVDSSPGSSNALVVEVGGF
jgi:signal transduction histidine kinase